MKVNSWPAKLFLTLAVFSSCGPQLWPSQALWTKPEATDEENRIDKILCWRLAALAPPISSPRYEQFERTTEGCLKSSSKYTCLTLLSSPITRKQPHSSHSLEDLRTF